MWALDHDQADHCLQVREDGPTTGVHRVTEGACDWRFARVCSALGKQRAQHEDADAIGRLNDKLSTYLGKPVELTPAASMPDALSRALDQFGRVFGGRGVVLKAHPGNTPSGGKARVTDARHSTTDAEWQPLRAIEQTRIR